MFPDEDNQSIHDQGNFLRDRLRIFFGLWAAVASERAFEKETERSGAGRGVKVVHPSVQHRLQNRMQHGVQRRGAK